MLAAFSFANDATLRSIARRINFPQAVGGRVLMTNCQARFCGAPMQMESEPKSYAGDAKRI